MTFEEIQAAIAGMLSIQKELQETQIKQSQEIQQLVDQGKETDKAIQQLADQGKETDRRIQQLIGYSISQAGDVIDVQMSLRDIYARLSKLEDKED